MTTTLSTRFATYVGIDVSKDKLDLYLWPENKHLVIDNTPAALAIQVEQWASTERLAVFEATGGYDITLWAALSAQGAPLLRLNPSHVRHFAKCQGQMAKTDRIDAKVIANYARVIEVAITAPMDRQVFEIKQLLGHRDDLVETRKRERTRIKQAISERVISKIKSFIDDLTARIKDIEADLARLIGSDEDLSSKVRIMQSMPGIGPVNVWRILAYLPELGRLGPKQVAMLVGVAPVDQQSGDHDRRRRIFGGRKEVRTALWMAAVTASQRSKRWVGMKQKFIDEGRPKKVALTAISRKMIVTLNAMIRDGKLYNAS